MLPVTCSNAVEATAANDCDDLLEAEYQQLNAVLTGVRIEGLAGRDKHRKAWVWVHCFHCHRSHRKVRLDSLKRPPKVGPDGKLRKAATSCGCLAKRAHRRNMAAMAEHVSFNKKLLIWTQMKLGTETEQVAAEFRMNKYLVGHCTREIGRLAQALKRERHVARWWRTCLSVQHEIREEGLPSRLSFHREGRKWVCDMESEVDRAKKILKKWAYFRTSPVKEVREILDLAAWVVQARKAGMEQLKRRFKKRPTKAEIKIREVEKGWDALLDRVNTERISPGQISGLVSQYVRYAENRMEV